MSEIPKGYFECSSCANLIAKLQAAEAAMPPTYYSSGTLDFRIAQMAENWNRAVLKNHELEAKLQAAEAGSSFLQRLAIEGGRIVSTASLKSVEIATAFNEGRMFVDDRRYGYVFVPETAQVIPESGGHIESADCWCSPTVEEHPGGTLIIHNQTH